MPARPVEAVLIVFYGPEAHRATYGRQVQSNRYTKDYIQLSRRPAFQDAVRNLFPVDVIAAGSVPLTYRWPGHSASGHFVFHSGDRPHLKWNYSAAPDAWKMSQHPSNTTSETIPGDPTQLTFDRAEAELAMLADRGAGQPYLMAIKLRDEPSTLHLRAYLGQPNSEYEWADIDLAPPAIRNLASRTTQSRTFQWALFQSGGEVPTLLAETALGIVMDSSDPARATQELGHESKKDLFRYLSSPGYGLFFDPNKNHDAWSAPTPLTEEFAVLAPEIVEYLSSLLTVDDLDDATAETTEFDFREFESFRDQIVAHDYTVEDKSATVKTRGSAQRAFADAVKNNYGWQCAVTGINSREYLVASHIVPWSKDRTIRLDPSNGICLSLLVDRAFEKGHLIIEDDLAIRVHWDQIANDASLRTLLEPIDGSRIRAPRINPPSVTFLQRRRLLVQE